MKLCNNYVNINFYIAHVIADILGQTTDYLLKALCNYHITIARDVCLATGTKG